MVTIGNDTLPGIITNVESAATAGANIGAPGVPVIVGQGYLAEGTANANEMHRVTRSSQADNLFGQSENSMLTTAIKGALVEGAYPVYAVAASEADVTGEDLSGVSGTTATLANAPVIESADDIVFTVNGTTKDTVLYYAGDPANATPGTDEVLLNPQTGKAEADESFGNTGDAVDYSYADYSGVYDIVDSAEIGDQFVREVIDFIVPVDENNATAVDPAHTKSLDMEQQGWFNIVLGGAGKPYIVDSETDTDETASYTNPYDSSRIQLVNPTRDDEGNTIIGHYAGRRSSLGIERFPIFRQLDSVTSLQRTLRKGEQENLVNAKVNPLEERRSSVRIIEDLTTVSDSNTDEAAWQRGFPRLLTDFVVDLANARAEPFIGEFNERSTLNSLRANVSSDLKQLLETGQVEAYSLVVEREDNLTAILDIGVNIASPLRNIEITVAAGDVTNGVSGSTGGE